MKIQTHGDNLSTYTKYIALIQAIHEYLQTNGYLQLDLPVLSPALIPEGYLEVFETEFRYMNRKEKLYLTPSPELFIKRLLAEGVGDCYYLGKSFRNSEPNSPKHLPEFTMLEMYKVRENYRYMAQVVRKMLEFTAKKIHGKDSITYNGKKIDLTRWEELTVAEAFEKYSGVSTEELFDTNKFLKKAEEKGYRTEGFTYEDLWSQMYTQEIEPYLGTDGHPTMLFDYPVCFAALSTPNTDGKTAQRFEFYIEGVELGNCYSELTDADLQDKRLADEYEERKKSGKIDHPIDKGFVDALRKGLPVSTGIAIGVERVGMVMLDLVSIEDLKLITIS